MLASAVVSMLVLDRALPTPLSSQVYDGLRGLILDRQLASGTRLPSSRALASELGVARITVTNAYEELTVEGYLEARVGSGTFVAPSLPDDLLDARAAVPALEAAGPEAARPSQRGQFIVAHPVTNAQVRRPQAFRTGMPALDQFPLVDWRRRVTRAWRLTDRDALMGYGDAAGYLPLREAIREHLAATRAVRCTSEQVIVTNGSQQGLDLVGRVLLDPGDHVWIENPCRKGANAALLAAGAQLIPVPVDRYGINVEAAQAVRADVRLAYVTPSHQFPLGVTLSLPRRLALLDWAQRSDAWIVEDDHNSEYRYSGRPLPALQGLDRNGRVIYVGTFSRAMFPGIRLGYLVVPRALAEAFAVARTLVDRHALTAHQAAMTAFIEDGAFARHLRRMRTEYAVRQEALLDAAAEHLDHLVRLEPAEAGIHLVGWLRQGIDDREAQSAAAAADVEVVALSEYYRGRPAGRGALIFGYPVSPPAETHRAVRRLAVALEPLAARRASARRVSPTPRLSPRPAPSRRSRPQQP